MSDPYRASVCGECGRPHDPPAVCRRCGSLLGASLRPACALCALRVALRLTRRALRAAPAVLRGTAIAVLWSVIFASTLGAAVGLAAFWIDINPRRSVARDDFALLIMDVETAIDAIVTRPRPSSPRPIIPRPFTPRLPEPHVCPRALAELAVPRVLSGLGAETRDPHVLMARASRLDAAGFDIDVMRAALPLDVALSGLAPTDPAANPPTIVPVRWSGGVVGVCLEGPGVLPRATGLLRGDVITSINGVPIVRPDLALEAYDSAKREGMAVIELLRGEKRVILGVSFPVLRRDARGPAGAGP